MLFNISIRQIPKTAVRPTRQAFTLIELLVVISIIMLLISITVPSSFQAKEIARTAACLANQHALAVTTTAYTVEYQGNYPFATNEPKEQNSAKTNDKKYLTWAKFVEEKLTENARICPGVVNAAYSNIEKKLVAADDKINGVVQPNWIAPNVNIVRRHDRAVCDPPAKASSFRQSTKIMLLIDNAGMEGLFAGLPPAQNYVRFRHMKGYAVNLTFLDGHGETWEYEKMDLFRQPTNLLGEDADQLPWKE